MKEVDTSFLYTSLLWLKSSIKVINSLRVSVSFKNKDIVGISMIWVHIKANIKGIEGDSNQELM